MTDAMQYRSAELRAVEPEARTIELLVAPYGVDGQIAPGVTERYKPGVFKDIGERSVPLKLETGRDHSGPVVGRSVSFAETPAGLVGTFRVSATRDGADALTLAADGALSASAGFLPLDVAPLDDGSYEVRAGDLREVTLTGVPAYRDAEVLAVRSNQGENVENETATNDAAETATESNAVADAVARALDEYRRGVTETEAADMPKVEGSPRGYAYRSLGEVVADVNRYARRSDAGASERLGALIEAGAIAADGSAIYLAKRAFTGPAVTGVDGAGVIPDSYIPDLLELLREGRPVANLFGGRALPDDGENVVLPKVTQGSTVDYQAAQGDTVSNQNVVTDSDTFPKSTLAGGQGVSIQSQRWTNPSYIDEVIRDHVAAYGEKVDEQSIIGDGATPNATAYTGILNGAGDIPAGGTGAADALGVIGKAWAAVYGATRRAPTAVIMHSLMWGAFLDLADTDGRPLVTTEAPMNPAGGGNAASIAGTVRGLPVYVDDNVPTNLGVGTNETPIVVCNFRDALLFENQGAPAQVALTYPDVLVTDVSVYGFSALAIRRPLAFQAISGVLTPT